MIFPSKMFWIMDQAFFMLTTQC